MLQVADLYFCLERKKKKKLERPKKNGAHKHSMSGLAINVSCWLVSEGNKRKRIEKKDEQKENLIYTVYNKKRRKKIPKVETLASLSRALLVCCEGRAFSFQERITVTISYFFLFVSSSVLPVHDYYLSTIRSLLI